MKKTINLDASWLETFAGTSSRLGQRLVTSEAAMRGWHMVALDVEKAFLNGVAYKELAEVTGKPKRDVCFELPADIATCAEYPTRLQGLRPIYGSSLDEPTWHWVPGRPQGVFHQTSVGNNRRRRRQTSDPRQPNYCTALQRKSRHDREEAC